MMGQCSLGRVGRDEFTSEGERLEKGDRRYLLGTGLFGDSTALHSCTRVCVFTLSVSALQFISTHPSAGGRVILFAPKCESATLGFNLTRAATFLPSCRCCSSGTGQSEEKGTGTEGGRGLARSSPIHCHHTLGLIVPGTQTHPVGVIQSSDRNLPFQVSAFSYGAGGWAGV